MFERTNMKIIEEVLIGTVLGAIFPILGFLALWWGTFTFLPDRLIFLMASVGLLIGILVDIVYLRRWVGSAYSINLKIWMAVYLFYSIGMFGLFMGVPVFNVLLAIPAGLFIGSKLARQTADHDEVRRMHRNTCVFTTGILAAVCVISAVIALVDPYTSLNLQGILGLQFEVTRLMLAGGIAIGGIALLLMQWGITGKVIHLTYSLMQTNGSALR
jgi:hypothetical protein